METRKLIYLPLERYASRWSEFISGPDGVFANKFREAAPDFELEVIAPHNELLHIKSGVVVDIYQRADWCFQQILTLIRYIQEGKITSKDSIYVEDFWHAGMEMLPYTCHLLGVHPKVYATCHAQSADPNDFCFPMLRWIRHFEVGWATWLTGIFVSDPILKTMLVTANFCPPTKIHATGIVMGRQTILDNIYPGLPRETGTQPRDKTVLFASRIDEEKRPELFIQLADHYRRLLRRYDSDPDSVKFRVLSGRTVPDWFKRMASDNQVEVRENITKQQYYEELASGSVLVNTAAQDFVSYGLLDALAFGCLPLVPDWLTFPKMFNYDANYLYLNQNMMDAAMRLNNLMSVKTFKMLDGDPVPELYQAYGAYYEGSVARMVEVIRSEEK